MPMAMVQVVFCDEDAAAEWFLEARDKGVIPRDAGLRPLANLDVVALHAERLKVSTRDVPQSPWVVEPVS